MEFGFKRQDISEAFEFSSCAITCDDARDLDQTGKSLGSSRFSRHQQVTFLEPHHVGGDGYGLATIYLLLNVFTEGGDDLLNIGVVAIMHYTVRALIEQHIG